MFKFINFLLLFYENLLFLFEYHISYYIPLNIYQDNLKPMFHMPI